MRLERWIWFLRTLSALRVYWTSKKWRGPSLISGYHRIPWSPLYNRGIVETLRFFATCTSGSVNRCPWWNERTNEQYRIVNAGMNYHTNACTSCDILVKISAVILIFLSVSKIQRAKWTMIVKLLPSRGRFSNFALLNSEVTATIFTKISDDVKVLV